MCRVVGTAYVEGAPSRDPIPHNERGVKNRIRQDENNRREMRQREGPLERLERERREGEAEEMAARVAEEDLRGRRVVDEESGAGADQAEGEAEMHRRAVDEGERRESARGHRDQDTQDAVHVVQ